MEASNIQQSNEGNTMIDTVTLATQEREKQGLWEVEVSYGGEVDLHRHLDRCEKNPGHLKFVPVDQFNMDHLPPDYHDDDLVDLVRVMSNLTVRVSVKYVSDGRPETVPGSDKPYPCYRNRGRNMSRVGTGYVGSVHIYPMENNDKQTCKCKECRNSPTPKTQFAHIHIYTATHVVYDDQEGAHTTCHLFFDRGGTPDLRRGVISLEGMAYVLSSIDTDTSLMVYATHDLDLADRLFKLVDHRHYKMFILKVMYSNRYSLPDMYERCVSRPIPDLGEEPIIIISHPHGCSKQISVGYCTHRDVMVGEAGDEKSMYTYNAATCPGSSGAPIFLVRWGWPYLDSGHVHSGNCEGSKELNHSCYGYGLGH